MDFTLTLKIGLLAWMLSQPALAQQFPNCNCTGNPQTYCTAGTSVLGCVPAMATSGVPNVLANSGFQLSVANVPAHHSMLVKKQSLVNAGLTGSKRAPAGKQTHSPRVQRDPLLMPHLCK
jgi:hypothetical protein